jgi:oxygen-independent coproporphyrinogen-3 oxidase
VDASTYAAWLKALPEDGALSLYLHVPFCHTLCHFCGCHTTAVRRDGPIAAYAADLRTEIIRVAEIIGKRLSVRHVHWGGGTPTSLAPSDITAIMALLRQRFAFMPDAEIAVEIDPRRLSLATLAALAEMGTTRASLGVQDFDPAVQAVVNRIQPYEMTASVVQGLRAAGIQSINLDLMYGLPHQMVEGVAATARLALTLRPDRLAVFGYAHVPWMKRHQKLLSEPTLPDGMERHRQREVVEEVLTAAGYVAIGLDHFARPSDAMAHAASSHKLRRNFQGYTTDQASALIGFGASAIGALPQGYVQNLIPIPEWQRAMRHGGLAVKRGLALSAEDRLRRDIIEEIMCYLAVDLDAITRAHGWTTANLLTPTVDELAADGLIAREGSRLAVTKLGRPFLRSVAAAFDSYIGGVGGADGPRHSQGV